VAHIILHHKGRYNIWSSIVDDCIFEESLLRQQLLDYIKEEYGNQGLRDRREAIIRAEKRGTSSMLGAKIKDFADNLSLSEHAFIKKYLS
jgi:hypothetical protein